MDRQTIPREYAFRAHLGATGRAIGNSNQLPIEVILDLIQQNLEAFSKFLPAFLADSTAGHTLSQPVRSAGPQQGEQQANNELARDLHRKTHQ